MITFHFISTALSPITHMHGTAGNVALLQREQVIGEDGQLHSIPCLSGNAMRHAMVRVAAAEYVVNQCGLTDMPYQLGDLLWHGGRLTKATPLTAAGTKTLLDTVPMLGLLGGALPGQILQGALRVSRGLLICKETAHIIEERCGVRPQNVSGAESYVGSFMYTRGAQENNPEAIADRMIYEGECVVAGSKFYHTMSVDSDDPLVLGCLLKAIQDSQKIIGGMSRVGHGELMIEFSSNPHMDVEKLIKDYEDYVTASREPVKKQLMDLFGSVEVADDAPAKKSAKKAAKKASDLPPADKALDAVKTETDFFSEV